MSFLPTNQLAELISFAAFVVEEVRGNLSLGTINDENECNRISLAHITFVEAAGW